MKFIHKLVYVTRFSRSGCTESSFSNLCWLYLGVELNPLLSQHPSREMRSECVRRDGVIREVWVLHFFPE